MASSPSTRSRVTTGSGHETEAMPLPTSQLSTPPAIKLPRLDPVTGPLYFDATGVWATTVTQLVVSPTEHVPDLLTGLDGEPWILSRPSPSTKTSFSPLEEWAQEMLELSAADRNNTLGSPRGFFFFIFKKNKISKIYVCFQIFQKYTPVALP